MNESPYRVLVIEDDEDVALFTRTAIETVREFRPRTGAHRQRVWLARATMDYDSQQHWSS